MAARVRPCLTTSGWASTSRRGPIPIRGELVEHQGVVRRWGFSATIALSLFHGPSRLFISLDRRVEIDTEPPPTEKDACLPGSLSLPGCDAEGSGDASVASVWFMIHHARPLFP